MESLQLFAAMGPSGQDSIMMLGAFFLGTMGWAAFRRFQLQLPRSKKLLDEDEEPEQVRTITGNTVDGLADKETGAVEAALRVDAAAGKKSAFQKKQAKKARRTAEKVIASPAGAEEADLEPARQCEGSAAATCLTTGTAGEPGDVGEPNVRMVQELAATSEADRASGPASVTVPVAAASPPAVAPNEEEAAATGVEESASGPAVLTEPLVEVSPPAAALTPAPEPPIQAVQGYASGPIQALEKKPAGRPQEPAAKATAAKEPEAEPAAKAVASLPETSPSSRSPTDRERMKLEKKLREVAKLEERAAAGEVLESLQLEKMAKADQLRAELAQLNAQEEHCVENAETVQMKEVQAWSEVPPVQAWKEVKEVGAWADVPHLDGEGLVDDKGPLMCGMYRDGTVVPAREPKENSWQGSKTKGRTDGAAWSKSGAWDNANKGTGWSWKESWSQRRAAQAQRRSEDAWMEPLDPFAEVQAMPCTPCGFQDGTAVSDDVCWTWQKYGCCEKFTRGKCGWEHPPLEEHAATCPMEDASQVQYYQLVEVDVAALGDMMGGAEVPMLMQGGTEMFAQCGPEVYDQVFMPSGPDVPMQFEAQVHEQPSCERERAYWEDWEEERVQEPSFPPQPPLPVFDGWAGPVMP